MESRFVFSIKKVLCGVIITGILTLIFGIVIILPRYHYFCKEVQCEITDVGEPEGVLGVEFNKKYVIWQQHITAVYKDKEWSANVKVRDADDAYHQGDTIELYLSGGKLTDYEGTQDNGLMAIIWGVMPFAFFCPHVWYFIQFFKMKK